MLHLHEQQNDNNNQGEQVCSDWMQSITPRCNNSSSKKKMKKRQKIERSSYYLLVTSLPPKGGYTSHHAKGVTCAGGFMLDVTREADLIRRVTKKVYWESKFARLRTQIDEEDLIQMVFLKLLHRENFKKYSDSFSLVSFLYRVANRCAISFATKSENLREWTVLDNPIHEDEKESSTMSDMLLYDMPNADIEIKDSVNHMVSLLDTSVKPNFVIRYNNKDIPFSIANMFRFFVETKASRKEMIPYIINTRTNSAITQSTFDKFWKSIDRVVKRELSV